MVHGNQFTQNMCFSTSECNFQGYCAAITKYLTYGSNETYSVTSLNMTWISALIMHAQHMFMWKFNMRMFGLDKLHDGRASGQWLVNHIYGQESKIY